MSDARVATRKPAAAKWVRPWPMRLVVVLAGLSAFGPLTTDLYLPGLPQLGADLDAPAAGVQLTLTTCVLGIAAGQLLIGPLSDVAGRRAPLLGGLLLFIAASSGCALAPSIAVLDVLRLIQGFAGAAGIVIARAMVRDMYSGLEAGRLYAALSSVLPLAPVLAPLIGGQLLLVTTWRGVFAAQAAVGIVLLIATLVVTHETLGRSGRRKGSLHSALITYRSLLHRRSYMTMALGGSMAFATLFAYISASSFVYQKVLGVSPQVFGLLFGVNGAGLLAVNIVNARLIRTIAMTHLLRAGVRILAAGGVLILVATVLHLGAWALLPLLFVSVSSVGLVISNSIALSMEGEGERAGSAAALFGMLQFAAGAAVAPLVGLAGASAVPMGVVMAAAGVAGLVVNGSQPRR